MRFPYTMLINIQLNITSTLQPTQLLWLVVLSLHWSSNVRQHLTPVDAVLYHPPQHLVLQHPFYTDMVLSSLIKRDLILASWLQWSTSHSCTFNLPWVNVSFTELLLHSSWRLCCKSTQVGLAFSDKCRCEMVQTMSHSKWVSRDTASWYWSAKASLCRQ